MVELSVARGKPLRWPGGRERSKSSAAAATRPARSRDVAAAVARPDEMTQEGTEAGIVYP